MTDDEEAELSLQQIEARLRVIGELVGEHHKKMSAGQISEIMILLTKLTEEYDRQRKLIHAH